MPTITIKRRIARAKKSAAQDLTDLGYKIIPGNNLPICLMAVREQEIRIIHVCIDKADKKILQMVDDYHAPSSTSREVWIKHEGARNFEIVKV